MRHEPLFEDGEADVKAVGSVRVVDVHRRLDLKCQVDQEVPATVDIGVPAIVVCRLPRDLKEPVTAKHAQNDEEEFGNDALLNERDHRFCNPNSKTPRTSAGRQRSALRSGVPSATITACAPPSWLTWYHQPMMPSLSSVARVSM